MAPFCKKARVCETVNYEEERVLSGNRTRPFSKESNSHIDKELGYGN